MVFIYINSRLLQVTDASREEQTRAAGLAGMCVARCRLGLGLGFHPRPKGLHQAPQPGPLKTVSVRSCLHLGSCPGRGPAPCLDQSC